MFEVIANRDLCQGAGQCVLNAPDIFDQDDHEGLVLVERPEVGDEYEEQLLLAVDRCPAQAIKVQRKSGVGA